MTRILNYFGSRSNFAISVYFISFFNLYGLSLLVAIIYDDHHAYEGGPTVMLTFALGPIISGVIVLISCLNSFIIKTEENVSINRELLCFSLSFSNSRNYLVCIGMVPYLLWIVIFFLVFGTDSRPQTVPSGYDGHLN